MDNISNISFQVPTQQNAMGNLISLASIVIDGVFLVSEIEICSLNGNMADVYVEWPKNFAVTNSDQQATLEKRILDKFADKYRGFPLREKPTLREIIEQVCRTYLSKKRPLGDF